MRKFKIAQNFDPATCQKIAPRAISPCNTKKCFLEHSFHVNFRKGQEISSKLNDSVKSYNKKTNRGVGNLSPPPPCRNRVNSKSVCVIAFCFGHIFFKGSI